MIPKIHKILDLSQETYHRCPAWPGDSPANVNSDSIAVVDGNNTERISMNSHTGTHLDAPFHYINNGKTIEQMDCNLFHGRGVILDLRKKLKNKIITSQDLIPFSSKIEPDDVVLIYTGWSSKYGINKEYLFEWPFLSKSAAEWLVDKKIKAVCTEGLSIGGLRPEEGTPPHQILLKNEIVIVEQVKMTDELLLEDDWYLMFFPIKYRGFGGSPTRVIAIKFQV